MARGNRKSRIFRNDRDRLNFLERLRQAIDRYHVGCKSWALMNTHYHSMLETPLGNISEVMKFLNGTFTQDWNRRYRSTGHVFEGRFVSVLIETGPYMRNVYRYIARNPVEAGYVASPTDWPWSSHSCIAGLVPHDNVTDLEGLELCFGGLNTSEAQRNYREFVETPVTGDDPCARCVIGSEAFESKVREVVGNQMFHIRVPRSYRALARPSLEKLFEGIGHDLETRNSTIVRAHVVYGYTQSMIARSLAVHPDTVSRIVCAIKRQRFFLVDLGKPTT